MMPNRSPRASAVFVAVFAVLAAIAWSRGAYGWMAFATWAAGVNTAMALRKDSA